MADDSLLNLENDKIAAEVLSAILVRLDCCTNDEFPTSSAWYEKGSGVELPHMDVGGIRKAKSIASIASSDAGDLSSFSSDDEGLDNFLPIGSDSDSEAEFERFLERSAAQRHNLYLREHHPIPSVRKLRSKPPKENTGNNDEYENLPALENLSLNCDRFTKLQKVGTVQAAVGFIVTVKSDILATLDLDTVLFTEDRTPFGAICDIIGTMKDALFCVKFKTKEEAAQVKIGTDVFYAPYEPKFTKNLLEKNLHGPWAGRGWHNNDDDDDSDEENICFSDDEKEKEYYARKAQKKNIAYCNALGIRKRNHNRVQFNLPSDSKEQEAGSHRGFHADYRGGRGQKFFGGRGRGSFQGGWNRNKADFGRQNAYSQSQRGDRRSAPSDLYESINRDCNSMEVETANSGNAPTAKPPQSTSDNPYAEFGCYGDSPITMKFNWNR